MRKIQTKGLKLRVKPIDRGVRFAVVLHGSDQPERAVEALQRVFDINAPLAKVAVSSAPVVLCRDLDQEVAVDYVRRLKGAGDFRAWVESATGKLRQMNLKQRGEAASAPIMHLRRAR